MIKADLKNKLLNIFLVKALFSILYHTKT